MTGSPGSSRPDNNKKIKILSIKEMTGSPSSSIPNNKKEIDIDFTANEQGPDLSNLSDSDEESKVFFDPGPRPCVIPEETTCFAMTLTYEAGELPMLIMSAEDVYLLTNKHISFLGEVTMLVFDRFNNPYQMNIIRRTSSPESFILDKGWSKFVGKNKVVRNESLVFNRFYTSGTCFYRLEVLKVTKSRFQLFDQVTDRFFRVIHADRLADRLKIVLPDIQRGTPDYNRLKLEMYEAIMLTGNIELFRIPPLRRVLTVLDEALFVYSIVLSDHHVEGGRRGYALSHGWSNIIERNRLIEGDRIFIRKFISPDGHFYYRLNVSRKGGPVAGLEDESNNSNE